jgi:hypothetical protein
MATDADHTFAAFKAAMAESFEQRRIVELRPQAAPASLAGGDTQQEHKRTAKWHVFCDLVCARYVHHHPSTSHVLPAQDGVLADFDAGVQALGHADDKRRVRRDCRLRATLRPIRARPPRAQDLWSDIMAAKDFFGTLPPCADAMELWRALAELPLATQGRVSAPAILTGLPSGKFAKVPGAEPCWMCWRPCCDQGERA